MELWVDQDLVAERLAEMGIDTTAWVVGISPTKLEKEILRQQRVFERSTRRKFEETTATILINGRGTSMLVLPEFPVSSITSITVFDEFLTADQGYLIQAWRLEEDTGRVHLSGAASTSLAFFPEGKMNVQVKYTYGYKVTPTVAIPDDIQDAIELMTTLSVIARSPKDFELDGLKGFKIGQYSETYGVGKDKSGPYYEYEARNSKIIQEIIDRYKKMLMGRA